MKLPVDMVTKEQTLSLTARGIASSLYWGFRLRNDEVYVNRTVDGVTADFPVGSESVGWSLWRHGGNMGGELSVIHDVVSNIKQDDVFWDIGANRGFYTAFVAQCCNKTTAFEPNDEPRPYLEHVKGTNNLQVQIRPEALGDYDGSVQLDNNTITPSDSQNDGKSVQIRQGRSLIEEGLKAPTVLKIDCEGAEKSILDGLGDHLESVRLAYIEPHRPNYDEFDTSWGAIEDLLRGYGFDLQWIETDCVNDILRATNN